jgi:hypothetical protein
MKRKLMMYVAVLRYPDGNWYVYSPDLKTKHPVAEDLTDDTITLGRTFIPDFKTVRGLSRPLDMLNARRVVIKMLLSEGQDWEKVFISLNTVYFEY